MEGLNTYRNTIAPLLFGADHAVLAQKRVATIQTLGGSGALKVGADFLKKYFPDSGVWVSDPTWETTWPSLKARALRLRPIHGSTAKPTAYALMRCWKN